MADFSSRINSIKADLDGLLGSINKVDEKVRRATQEFELMAEQADDIATLATAIQKLERVLKNEKSPLIDNLKTQVAAISNELNKLDVKNLSKITTAFENQAKAVKDVTAATSKISTSLQKASEGLTTLTGALEGIKNSGADVTLEKVVGALTAINSLTNVRSVLNSVNTLKASGVESTISALQDLKNVLTEINKLSEVNVKVRTRKTTAKDTQGDVAPEAEKVVKDVATKQTVNDSGAKTDESQSAVNKLVKRAQGIEKINRAIEAIEAAQLTVLKGLVDDQQQSAKFEAAKKALISRLSSKDRALALDDFISTTPDASAITKQFQSKISKVNVPTDLGDEFGEVNLSDRKVIDGLYRLRERAVKDFEELKNAINPPAQASASILSNLQSFSTSVYRPISYGVSEFGAFMNGIISVLKGVKTGGIRGAIDALDGAFKSLHALNNFGAYLGTPLLPAGLGGIFNRRRADTITDVVEVGLNLTQGRDTSQDQRRIRELQTRERSLVRQRDALKQESEADNISDDAKKSLESEINQVNEELKRLRATIRSYNEVMKDAAERDGVKAPLTSTGASLSKESVVTAQGSYTQAMDQAQSRIQEIMARARYLSSEEFNAAYAKRRGNSGAVNPNTVAGFQAEEGGVYINTRFDKETQRGVAYHEATHELLADSDRYRDNRGIRFRDTELEDLRNQARGNYLRVRPSRTGDIFADSARGNAATNPNYAYQATEIYANVNQAILTGNRKFEVALREIYGDKLFDKIAADLRSLDPGAHIDPARYAQKTQEAARSPIERIVDRLKTIFGPIYDTLYNSISFYIDKIKETLGGALGTKNPQGLGQAAASILLTTAPDAVTGVQRTYKTPDIQPDLLTALITKYEPQINAALDAVTGITALKGGTQGLSGLLSGENLGKFAETATKLLGINTEPLTKAIGFGGLGNLAPQIIKALVEPSSADFKALGNSVKNVNISRLLETYFKEQFNLKPYTLKEFGERAKNLEAPFAGLFLRPFLGKAVTNIADSFNEDDPNVDPRSARRGRFFRGVLKRGLIDQLTSRNVDFEDELNEEIRSRTGRNIRRGSYSQTAAYDPVSGVTKFTVSAQTADGAMVSLNAHVDEFGRKKITDPAEEMDYIANRFKRFVNDIPNQLIQQVTYSVVAGIQQMAAGLISVQDELSEVANLYGVVGDKAKTVKDSFLSGSVSTAIDTGQGFQEAIQTNLKNFKLLGAVKDPQQREQLANDVSKVQLGAQTAFGISLEQSLESIPSILSDIQTRMGNIDDPVKRVTSSVEELKNVMDQIIVAQRATGASGDELLTVYARLAASAREYGLSSKDLIALTSVSSVSIGKGSDETTNILKSFLEGTYSQANESQLLKDFGIATKITNKDTGQISNRPFTEVLKDIVAFTQNPETSGRTSQLLQVFAGPKPAADIGKVVKGYGADFTRSRGELDQPNVEGSFGELITGKIDNYQGSINKLNAAGTELFSTFLVGAGVIDKLTNFLEHMSQAASALAGFLRGNAGVFKLIVDVVTPNIIDKMTSGLLGAVNVFSPFVKILATGQTTLRGLFSQLIGFDKVVKPIDTVQVTLKAMIGALEAVEKSGGKASASVVKGMQTVASEAKAASASVLAQAETQGAVAAASVNNATSVNKYFNPNTKLVGQVKGTLQDLEEAYSTETPRVSGQARLPERIRKIGATVGDAAGSVVAPLAFDILAGGLRTDNIAVNTGAAVAGAFVGAVTANPALGVFFYSIFGEILDRIDVGKFFHLSDREADAFSSSIARRIRKNLGVETKDDIAAEDTTQREKERKDRATSIAIQRTSDIEDVFGVKQFRERYNQASAANVVDTYQKQGIVQGQSSADLERYMRLIVEGKQPEGIMDRYFLSWANQGGREGAGKLYGELGNDTLRQLYAESNITDPTKFLKIFEDLGKGQGPLLDRKDIQDALVSFDLKQTNGVTTSSTGGETNTALVTESAGDIIKRLNETLTEVNDTSRRRRDIPYGADTYSPFGSRQQAIERQFAPQLEAIRGGKITGQQAQNILDQYEKAKAALDSIPQSLQVLIPLAQELNLATDGLEQKLYNIGSEGQQKLVQRFQPALTASDFNSQYEQKARNLQYLQRTDQYRAKDPEILKEVDALQKALATDKARYDINKAYLSTIKDQTNILLDQAGVIEKQNQTRQLISAGTPAQFTPANIFDTKGINANELNAAIEFAIRKQNKLAALNPEYRKEFAKDQFLLQSGTDFKGVTGVNQGFVQEYLQSQKQQQEAPLQDLSKYSDQELQKILDQARNLQKQAETLDPARAGKYDNERILILRKNNELLSQTGIGQEFLKAALDANTKSTDQLRGHYNLPSSYKQPTIWDYYNNGGREQGDKNFPTTLANGMVPLSFAQQLAREMIAGGNGEKGANLDEIVGANQAGARPLFYPNPGTAAVYSEVPPQVLPDTIKSDKNISDAVQRFFDFKQRQIEDFDAAIKQDAAYSDDLGNNRTKPTNGPKRRDNSFYTPKLPGEKPSDLAGAGNPGTLQHQAFKDAQVNLADFNGALKDGKAVTSGLAAPLAQAANAGKTFATNIPSALTNVTSSAQAFATVISNIQQRLSNLDLAKAISNSNIQIQVTINGQTITADAGQVKVTNSGSGGSSSLSAGTKAGSTRQ